MTDTEKEFEEYREYLRAEIMRLCSYVKLYRHLYDLQANRFEIMRTAQAFFGVTMSALLTSIVIWTNTILGKRSERGLRDFLDFIERHLPIFDVDALKKRRGYPDNHWMLDREPITMDTINGHRRELDALPSLPSFKTLRDKFYAHFDKKYFFDRAGFQRAAPLKWSDLDEVTDATAAILDHYSKAYDGEVSKAVPDNIHDIDLLLDRATSSDSEC